jgi:transglutaminase-like putative cysteine protease
MKAHLAFFVERFEGRLLWLVFALFVLSLVSVSPLIADWLWPGLAAVLLWFVAVRRWKSLRRWNSLVMLVTVSGYIAAVFLSQLNWLSAQAISGFLVLVILLKLIEIQKKSEVLWIIAAMLVLVGIGTLYWNSIQGFAFLMLLLFGMLFSLVLLFQSERLQWQRDLFVSFKLFALAMPLAVLMFFLMPRYEGPLWDLGIAFGVPINLTQSAPPEPMLEGNRLRSDRFSDFLSQSNTVLIAEFKGKVPYKSDMYWRGPVFSHFDGKEWYIDDEDLTRNGLMRDRYRTKKQWENVISYKGSPQKYHVKVMPHGQRWLYALDTSTPGSPETFLSRDFQLMSIRNIHQEFGYDSFWIQDFQLKPQVKDQDWLDALDYPQGQHPRLQQYGKQLAHDYGDESERILALYRELKQSFYKRERSGALQDNYLDKVWFDDHGGSVLDMASAMVLILRASGMPTRLVTGFRGGNLVALTDYVMVKQSHAHIWVETWVAEQGWVRVEVQDFINTSKKQVKSALVSELKSAPHQQTDKQKTVDSSKTAIGKEGNYAQQPSSDRDSSEVQGHSQESWWQWLDDWLVDYDSEKQQALFASDGAKDNASVLRWGLLFLLVPLLLIPVWLFINMLRSRQPQDPIQQLYYKLQIHLQTQVQARAGECPSQYLKRLAQQDESLALLVEPLIEQYLNYRYGAQQDANEHLAAKQALKKQFTRVLGMLS